MRRALGVGAGLVGLLAGLAAAGCGNLPSSITDRGTDASAPDGSPVANADAGVAPPADREGLSPGACFDGIDNDDYFGADCSDEACARQAICCVGVASADCCGAPTPTVSWTGALGVCADGPVDGCPSTAALGIAFGLPLPRVDEGAIVPNGEPAADSGLVLARPVSPRTSIVRLEASLAAPAGCTGCVDGVAIGLAQDALGDANVTPVVAVQVSGSRGEVSLVAGGTTIWRHPLPDTLPHAYTLTTQPDGRVTLEVDFALEGAAPMAMLAVPAGALDVVLYGRTTNRGPDQDAARVLGLQVSESHCDMPASLERGSGTLAAPIGAPFAGRAHAPDVYPGGDAGAPGPRLVFAASGSIWMAEPDGSGGWRVPTGASPALPRAQTATFDDPSLIAMGDRWALFVTARDTTTGLASIQVVEGDAPFVGTFDPARLRGVMTAMPEGVVEMDGASAFRDGEQLVLVARTISRGESGERESAIVLLRGTASDLAAGGSFSPDSGLCGNDCESLEDLDGLTTTLHAPRHDVPGAFDHDEVAAPALIQTPDGVYRLYFAGRQGARWSIGMLVSMDLAYFRDPVGAAILAGTGEGRDALGVRDPAPWIHETRLLLHYTGTDGAQTHVLAADQPLE